MVSADYPVLLVCNCVFEDRAHATTTDSVS